MNIIFGYCKTIFKRTYSCPTQRNPVFIFQCDTLSLRTTKCNLKFSKNMLQIYENITFKLYFVWIVLRVLWLWCAFWISTVISCIGTVCRVHSRECMSTFWEILCYNLQILVFYLLSIDVEYIYLLGWLWPINLMIVKRPHEHEKNVKVYFCY